MSYTAKSLEEIAALFDERGIETGKAGDRMTTVGVVGSLYGESRAWHAAADILRRTTITEPDADDTARALVTKAEAA